MDFKVKHTTCIDPARVNQALEQNSNKLELILFFTFLVLLLFNIALQCFFPEFSHDMCKRVQSTEAGLFREIFLTENGSTSILYEAFSAFGMISILGENDFHFH